MAYKKWVVRDADKDRASVISEKFNIDPFIAFLLVSRGIDDDLAVSSFFTDSFEMVSPYNFVDMEEASFVIGDAIDLGQKICVYGDYDCDGVTSTALLYSFLKNEGADVCYYIPDRADEGYGLNIEAIDSIKSKGVDLIITVDNGISAIEEAKHIYDLGMRLVVTDHHQLADELPMAEAIVNPHRSENDLTFRDYCGVGVAFKLICALYDGDLDELIAQYVDLVAIGTIADLMPLQAENRAFVRAGLNVINNSPRPSIQAFVNSNGKKKYTSTDIAFQLCPRINAMGRMDKADRAVEFLLSDNEEDCAYKYEQLSIENSSRQETERKILQDIIAHLDENPELLNDRVIVIAGENYHYGVIGIVASHIVEKTGKPAFVIGIDENGEAHGSARSIEGFNIFDAISACEDDLIRFGGHPLAAGITLESNKIDDFRRHINEYAYDNYEKMPVQELVLDCKLSPFYLDLNLVENLSVLEPYGVNNPQAVFGIFNMKLLSVTPLSDGKHIRMELEKKGKRIKVVKFGTAIDDFPYSSGDLINVAVKVSKNFYADKTYLSVQAVDIHLASTDDEKYLNDKNDFDILNRTGVGDMNLYPNRDICAVVYRYLKTNNGYKYGLDNLYFRLQKSVNYTQLYYALKAFEEADLIENANQITMKAPSGKVDLENTNVLTDLRNKLNF